MNFLQALILGVVQGFTEFLPVSSSGHLVIGKALLGVHEDGINFEVFVHFGTLLSVVTFYRHELVSLVRSFAEAVTHAGRVQELYRQDRNLRWVAYIVAGTIPAGVIGVLFEAPIERAFSDAHMVSGFLLVTGTILLSTRFIRPPQRELTMTQAVLVGCAQAFAILPGVSRSGSTISAGMMLGLAREEAVKYSFLLSIPVILGATVLKLAKLLSNLPGPDELLDLGAGTIAAFISGYAAIKLLVIIARGGKLDYFAWYCYAVGIAGLCYF